jgi:hypothetical protein
MERILGAYVFRRRKVESTTGLTISESRKENVSEACLED